MAPIGCRKRRIHVVLVNGRRLSHNDLMFRSKDDPTSVKRARILEVKEIQNWVEEAGGRKEKEENECRLSVEAYLPRVKRTKLALSKIEALQMLRGLSVHMQSAVRKTKPSFGRTSPRSRSSIP